MYCGSDELECLIDKTAEDLLNSVPTNWLNTEVLTLPRKNPNEEKGHSWIIADKNILMEAPMDYWKQNKGSNNVPIVIGRLIVKHVIIHVYYKKFSFLQFMIRN